MRNLGIRMAMAAAVLAVAGGGAAPLAVARTAPAAPQPYSVGTLRWSFEGEVPDTVRAQITDAMDWAVNQANTLAGFSGNVRVAYSPDTPTADANYESRIRFGGAISRRVALHELAHWLGSGTYGGWNDRVEGDAFRGTAAQRRAIAYDGPAAIPHADRMHFWPYGLNFDHEFVEPQRNVHMVSAQRSDMALGDAVGAIAGERRILNREAGSMLAPVGERVGAIAWRAAIPAWQVTYHDGFVTLADARGRALGQSGTGVSLAATTGTPGQQWEMIPTDTGWFRLRNRETGRCLAAAPPAAAIAACTADPAQQWHLAR